MKLIEKIGMGVVLMVASASASAFTQTIIPTNSIPEPSTWALLAIGVMGVFFANRKK